MALILMFLDKTTFDTFSITSFNYFFGEVQNSYLSNNYASIYLLIYFRAKGAPISRFPRQKGFVIQTDSNVKGAMFQGKPGTFSGRRVWMSLVVAVDGEDGAPRPVACFFALA